MILDVYLDPDPDPIGVLERSVDGAISFAYRVGYGGRALSLSLPLDHGRFGDRATRGFFENLLPEGDRRDAIAARARLSTADVAGLLAIIGRDCAGAVSVVPSGERPIKVPGDLETDYRPISNEQLRQDLEDLRRSRLPRSQVRFSLAGVQSKMAVTIAPEAADVILEPAADAVTVPSTHILKVSTRDHPALVHNEYICLKTAAALGLPVANAEFREIHDHPVLLVERFDRRVGGGRVDRQHQEDGCQALGLASSLKYQETAADPGEDGIFEEGAMRFEGPSLAAVNTLLRRTSRPALDRQTLIKAALLNFLLGNEDAHAKNYSFQHLDSGGVVMAPLYDLVCTARYEAFRHQDFALWIGRCRNPADLNVAHIHELLQQLGIQPRAVNRIIEGEVRTMTADILKAFDRALAEAPFPRISVEPVRDVVLARVDHMNRALGWD